VASETGSADVEATGQVELIDGGVLDNIPLGWAVRTVAAMPAARAVDRWLLYLQPAPGEVTSTAPGTRRSASRIVRLLLRTLSLKSNTESVLDDTRELSQLAAAAAQQDAVLRNLLPAGDPTALSALADRIERYRLEAGRTEVARLRTLVTEPLTFVAPDPLPLPPQSFPLGGQLTAGSAGMQLLQVEDDQAAVFVLPAGTALHQVGSAARSPLVAARAATLVLHVLRQVEDLDGAPCLAGLRDKAYALRLACEVTVAARDRMLLVLAAAGPSSTEPLMRSATAALASVLAGLPAADGSAEGWRLWAGACAQQAPAGTADLAGSDTWPDSPYAVLWDGAVRLAEDVHATLSTLPGLPAQTPLSLLRFHGPTTGRLEG